MQVKRQEGESGRPPDDPTAPFWRVVASGFAVLTLLSATFVLAGHLYLLWDIASNYRRLESSTGLWVLLATIAGLTAWPVCVWAAGSEAVAPRHVRMANLIAWVGGGVALANLTAVYLASGHVMH